MKHLCIFHKSELIEVFNLPDGNFRIGAGHDIDFSPSRQMTGHLLVEQDSKKDILKIQVCDTAVCIKDQAQLISEHDFTDISLGTVLVWGSHCLLFLEMDSKKDVESILPSIRGKKKSQRFYLLSELTFVGRRPENDIQIDQDGIADRHALFLKKNNDVYLIDLVSRLGTSVNSEKIEKPVCLSANSRIAFDLAEFQFEHLTEASEPNMKTQIQASPGVSSSSESGTVIISQEAAKLLVKSGPLAEQVITLDEGKETIIARKPILSNATIVDDPSISREKHCTLFFKEDGWYIMDNDSTNGVYVNSQKQKMCKLQTGDQILLGNVEMIFQEGPRAPAPSPSSDSATKSDSDEAYYWDQKTIVE